MRADIEGQVEENNNSNTYQDYIKYSVKESQKQSPLAATIRNLHGT